MSERDLNMYKTLRYVYIIEVDNRGNKSSFYASKHVFYTGQTGDIARRLKQHITGVGSNFLRNHFRNAQKKLVFVKQLHGTEPDAIREEYRIKPMSKERKKKLILGAENDLVSYVPLSHIILRNFGSLDEQHVIYLNNSNI